MKLKLAHPVTFGDEVIDHIEVKEVRAEHLWELEPGRLTLGQLLEVAGRASGHPPAAMRLLHAADAMKIAEAVGGFFDAPASGPRKRGS